MTNTLNEFLNNMSWMVGYNEETDKQHAITIFNSVRNIDVSEFNEIQDENESFIYDANLHSVIEYLLEENFTLENIVSNQNIIFYYSKDYDMYAMTTN